MQLFRVAWVDMDWESKGLGSGDAGHPLFVYVRGQGAGRFDNPIHYAGLYLAQQPFAAVGEVFGHLREWRQGEIERARHDEDVLLVRCLVTVESDANILDLDSAEVLLELGWRPSDVVGRDRELTQGHALHEWFRRAESGMVGFGWWSYWRPSWEVAMLWSDAPDGGVKNLSVVDCEPLSIEHPSVMAAAAALNRPIIAHDVG